ncbi:MAG: hypothetical protein B7Y02_09720 [Rhodobacterales bacterium 17-64-5]|nr:MAG: hypothetical protein B7Y02_09720 [Rhodobacterales bacterium 17-64-5]
MLPVLLLDPPELDSRAVLGIGFMLGLVFVTVCAIAAPGFLGFRSILWVLGRRDWPSFAVAGMATALFGILWTWNDLSIERLVQNPPGLLVPLIGGVAGAVQFHAERYLARVRLLRAPSK